MAFTRPGKLALTNTAYLGKRSRLAGTGLSGPLKATNCLAIYKSLNCNHKKASKNAKFGLSLIILNFKSRLLYNLCIQPKLLATLLMLLTTSCHQVAPFHLPFGHRLC